jgi:hypothetical protein
VKAVLVGICSAGCALLDAMESLQACMHAGRHACGTWLWRPRRSAKAAFGGQSFSLCMGALGAAGSFSTYSPKNWIWSCVKKEPQSAQSMTCARSQWPPCQPLIKLREPGWLSMVRTGVTGQMAAG